MSSMVDAAIVGAGPYGLSCAAHLGSGRVHIFGRTMSFWREHMPSGMFLRSPAPASSLSGPSSGLRLEDYEREHDCEPARPVPLDRFVDYGEWFQRRAALEPDPRAVAEIAPDGGGFRLALEDGETLLARNVIVAAGIEMFAWRPPEFSELSPTAVSHSVDHARFDQFRGRRVVVVGAGQSAIESAALLHEAGAEVVVVARRDRLNWLVRSGRLHRMKTLRRFLYAPSDIGPAGVSWLVELPDVFRRIPRRVQDPLAVRAIRPAASHWLIPRTRAVPIHLGRAIARAAAVDGGARVELDDGSVLDADHVLLATGYRVDIARYPFLSADLVRDIARAGGYPKLGRGFESSVRGLYFVGAPAAWSFGPLFRFVAGTSWAAPRVAAALGAVRHTPARRRPEPEPETSTT
jgi:cation diffusion facilitator CzcD-associated flavoprotein CzcO